MRSDSKGRVATVARPATESLSGLADQVGSPIVDRDDVRVWSQSGVERVRLGDGRTVILKYAIPDFREDDALAHAAVHGVPVPALLGSTPLPDGIAIFIEDLGPATREPDLGDAAVAAVAVHRAPGPPGRRVLSETALSDLPGRAVEHLGRLQSQGRWNERGALALRDDLERVADVAGRRARGADIAPFGLCHSEFHPTSVHVGEAGLHVLDLARSYTGPGLLDLASWQGTQHALDLGQVRDLMGAYQAAGGAPSTFTERGGLPAEVWASAWHKMWVVEWFIDAQNRFHSITDPTNDAATIEAVHVHLREVVGWLVK